MFCNVPVEAVIEAKDVDHSIYEMPLMLQRERLDDLVCRLLHLTTPAPKMAHWQEIIRKLIAPQHRVRVGVVARAKRQAVPEPDRVDRVVQYVAGQVRQRRRVVSIQSRGRARERTATTIIARALSLIAPSSVLPM